MITKEQVREKIEAVAALPTHPKRKAKIKQLREVEIIVSSYSEDHLTSQFDRLKKEIQIIKSGMDDAIKNMGESIPEATRRKSYIEEMQLRKKQRQALYIKYIITGKGLK
jgi:hypothetical protein